MDTGDYIYLNLGANVSHGLLVVGWGPAVECPYGLNAPRVSSVDDVYSIYGQYQLERIPDTVPYVVDFGYSFNESENKTGWLQDPRPRPFYCSALTISSSNTAQMNAHLTRLGFGGGTLTDYLARLRDTYRPYLRDDDLHPAWEFIHIPNIIAPYGVLSS